jgi:hypothetical protein
VIITTVPSRPLSSAGAGEGPLRRVRGPVKASFGNGSGRPSPWRSPTPTRSSAGHRQRLRANGLTAVAVALRAQPPLGVPMAA